MHYDQKCDTAYLARQRAFFVGPCNCRVCNNMRETGIEPASLAAPDPKSGAPLGSITPAEGANATRHRSTPPNPAPTTTKTTTRAFSSAVSGSLPRPVLGEEG